MKENEQKYRKLNEQKKETAQRALEWEREKEKQHGKTEEPVEERAEA